MEPIATAAPNTRNRDILACNGPSGIRGSGPIRSITSYFVQPPNASSRKCASEICASGWCVMVMNQTRLKNSDHAVSQ
ncbi:hypothetical protein V1289_007624 [Bradyrhizobium sp. AZCC 2289]